MIRWFANIPFGRRFYRTQCLQATDLPDLIVKMAENPQNAKIRFTYRDGLSTSEGVIEERLDLLRSVACGERGPVQSVWVDEYAGKRSLKTYVEVHTPKVRVDIAYISKVQKKDVTRTRRTHVDSRLV